MSEFSTLEANILRAKGVTDEALAALGAAGIGAKTDFATVGDAATLVALVPSLGADVAAEVMAWAVGAAAPAGATTGPGGRVVLDTSDAVYCVHCQAKQPKDYSSGDLCVSCGKQVEPTESCYWCGVSGPGRFCRSCGAQFVPAAELELALVLRADGLPKDEIPRRLAAMTADEKDALWGRARRSRG